MHLQFLAGMSNKKSNSGKKKSKTDDDFSVLDREGSAAQSNEKPTLTFFVQSVLTTLATLCVSSQFAVDLNDNTQYMAVFGAVAVLVFLLNYAYRIHLARSSIVSTMAAISASTAYVNFSFLVIFLITSFYTMPQLGGPVWGYGVTTAGSALAAAFIAHLA